MVEAFNGFLFPFGIDEATLKRISKHPFLSRWTIYYKYSNGYYCYDKYYHKKCYFERREGTPVIVYDWLGRYEPYELRKFALVQFNDDVLARSRLVEIFVNRYDYGLQFRLLVDGRTPMEILIDSEGNFLSPYGEKFESINDAYDALPSHNDEFKLPPGFEIYRTFDEKKRYRIIHKSGLYFVKRENALEAHIPYLGAIPIDELEKLTE